MPKPGMGVVLMCAGWLGTWGVAHAAAQASGEVSRGEYLVNFGGCHDCHSPKTMTPQGPTVDPARMLSGHRAEAKVPEVPPGLLGPQGWGALTTHELTAWAGPWGISYAANLTPDATGIGGWTQDQFIKTIRTGKHLGVGRQILPPMPWQQVRQLSDRDLRAVFMYLRSLKPVANRVPDPNPPRQ